MLTNTHLFQEQANTFRKDGIYINAPKNSIGYREYWDEMTKRCTEGITIGDLWIPGSYYFYLNFTQILRKVDGVKEKRMDFPRFTDVDLEFFLLYERAIKEDKGLILVKPRRTGFSYKVRSLASHKYTFTRNSSTIIGAFDSKYSNTTMAMALDSLNFLNENTAWKKQRNPDTSEYIKARYQKELPNGTKIWAGSMSQMEAITFKNNPFASAGKSVSLFIFEEAGLFDNIIESYNISEPTWKDGDAMIGIPLIFGSAGDMEGGTVQFHQMFYDPEAYNLLALDNIWDEGKANTKCGWFFPASKQRFGKYKDVSKKYPEYGGVEMVDKDGNSLEFLGKQSVLDERERKKFSEKAFKDHKTQYPLNLFEAFLRNTGVYFPAIDLAYRLAEVETDKILQQSYYTGELMLDSKGSVNLVPTKGVPIKDFPLKDIDVIEGAMEFYELPKRNSNGVIFPGRYIIGLDPVDDDGNDSLKNSLQSCIVFDLFTDRIVAEYTGRTRDVKVFYENVRRLAIYYNASINYENNKKGFFGYMNTMNSLYLLADTPSYLKETDLVKGSLGGVNQKKGTPSNSSYMKKHYEDLINSYLIGQAVDKDEGVLNLHTLKGLALLKELIAYDRIINTDRISALSMVMVLREELMKFVDTQKKPTPGFFESRFFKKPINKFKMIGAK